MHSPHLDDDEEDEKVSQQGREDNEGVGAEEDREGGAVHSDRVGPLRKVEAFETDMLPRRSAVGFVAVGGGIRGVQPAENGREIHGLGVVWGRAIVVAGVAVRNEVLHLLRNGGCFLRWIKSNKPTKKTNRQWITRSISE